MNNKTSLFSSLSTPLKVDFQGSRVTSDGGLLLVRELHECFGLSELIAEHLTDSRGKNTQLPMADLLRQAVYSRLAGYEDVNDAERLTQYPTFRLMGSERIWERGAALTSRVQSFETELLTQEENLSGLAAINRELIARAEAIDSPQCVVLDMDRTEIPVHGQQEQSTYNKYSVRKWYFAPMLRAKPEIYKALEEQGVKYAIRIPANAPGEHTVRMSKAGYKTWERRLRPLEDKSASSLN